MAVNFTPEQFEKVLAELASNRRGFESSNISFDGQHSTQAVENFLSAATVLKAIERMSDQDALNNVHILLKGEAATWWNEIKSRVTSWHGFKKQLRRAFATKRPAFMIYKEIISNKQGDFERTKTFVKKQRKLFAQIHSIEESQQLNIIYGQLNSRIRERLNRDSVRTYEELLKAARAIEKLEEATKVTETNQPEKNKRKRCGFCRMKGHTMDVCIKRAKAEAETPEGMPVRRKYKIVSEPQTSSSEPKDSSGNPIPKIVVSVIGASSSTPLPGQNIEAKTKTGQTIEAKTGAGQTIEAKTGAGPTIKAKTEAESNADEFDANKTTTAASGAQDSSPPERFPSTIVVSLVKVEAILKQSNPAIDGSEKLGPSSQQVPDDINDIYRKKYQEEANTRASISKTKATSSSQSCPRPTDKKVEVETKNASLEAEAGNTSASKFSNSGNASVVASKTNAPSSSQPPGPIDVCRLKVEVPERPGGSKSSGNPTTSSASQSLPNLFDITCTNTNVEAERTELWKSEPKNVVSETPGPTWAQLLSMRTVNGKKSTEDRAIAGSVGSNKAINIPGMSPLPPLSDHNIDMCRNEAEDDEMIPRRFAPTGSDTQAPSSKRPGSSTLAPMQKKIKARIEAGSAGFVAGGFLNNTKSMAVASETQSPSSQLSNDNIPSSTEICREKAKIESAGGIASSRHGVAPLPDPSRFQSIPDHTMPSSVEIWKYLDEKARKEAETASRIAGGGSVPSEQPALSKHPLQDSVQSSAAIRQAKAEAGSPGGFVPKAPSETPTPSLSQRLLDHIPSSADTCRKRTKIETEHTDVFAHRKQPTSHPSEKQNHSSPRRLPSPLDIREATAEENSDAFVRRSRPKPVASGKHSQGPTNTNTNTKYLFQLLKYNTYNTSHTIPLSSEICRKKAKLGLEYPDRLVRCNPTNEDLSHGQHIDDCSRRAEANVDEFLRRSPTPVVSGKQVSLTQLPERPSPAQTCRKTGTEVENPDGLVGKSRDVPFETQLSQRPCPLSRRLPENPSPAQLKIATEEECSGASVGRSRDVSFETQLSQRPCVLSQRIPESAGASVGRSSDVPSDTQSQRPCSLPRRLPENPSPAQLKIATEEECSGGSVGRSRDVSFERQVSQSTCVLSQRVPESTGASVGRSRDVSFETEVSQRPCVLSQRLPESPEGSVGRSRDVSFETQVSQRRSESPDRSVSCKDVSSGIVGRSREVSFETQESQRPGLKPVTVAVAVQTSCPLPEYVCAGCGAPDVMRSKCSTCSIKQESTALRDARAKITELTAKNGALERQNMESQRKITVLERMNEELVQSNYEYSRKLAHYTDKNKVVKPPKRAILLDQPMPMSPPTSATDSRRNQGPSGKGAKKRPHPESQTSTLTDSPPRAPAEPYGVFELRSDPLPIKTEPDPLEDLPGVSTTFINPLGVSTTFIEPFEDPGTTSTTLTNPLGNSSTVTNPLGGSSTITNPLGGPSTITNPLGGPSTITNPLGGPSTITNPLGDSNTTYIDLLGDSSQFVSPLAAIPSSIGSGNERCTLYGETNNGLISVENIKIEEDMTIVEHNLEEEEMYTVIVTDVNS